MAIERLNRVQNRLDLLFADAASGKCAERAHRARQILDQPRTTILHFLATESAFCGRASARDSAIFIYTILRASNWRRSRTAIGKSKTSPVDEKTSNQVYFTSTQKSPIERQFYRVALSGGEPVELTHEHGTHGVSMAPDGQHFLDTYSNAMTPPQQRLYNADGALFATLEENKVAELESYHLQPEEFFTVPGADGTPLDAAMIKPAGFDASRKYPVIVIVYGGPHVQEVRDGWGDSTFFWNEMMAEKGFVIFMLDNRGSSGRGHNFETPIYHHFGSAELADQLAGVKWLSKQPYVDPRACRDLGLELWRLHDLRGHAARRRRLQGGLRGGAGDRLAAVRHDLHRALHGHAAGKSRRLSRFVAGEFCRRPARQAAHRARHGR